MLRLKVEIDTKPFQGLKRVVDDSINITQSVEIDTKPFQGLKRMRYFGELA
jgi:hypothetical protein